MRLQHFADVVGPVAGRTQGHAALHTRQLGVLQLTTVTHHLVPGPRPKEGMDALLQVRIYLKKCRALRKLANGIAGDSDQGDVGGRGMELSRGSMVGSDRLNVPAIDHSSH